MIRIKSQGHETSCPCFSGGEGGIRTREPLQVTHIPGVRARPTTRPLRVAFVGGRDYTTIETMIFTLFYVVFLPQRPCFQLQRGQSLFFQVLLACSENRAFLLLRVLNCMDLRAHTKKHGAN